MDALEHDIEEVEQEVFSAERTNPAERIYELKREAIDFARAVSPAGRAHGAHDRRAACEQIHPRGARRTSATCSTT